MFNGALSDDISVAVTVIALTGLLPGASILGANDAHCIVEISAGESLEILYDAMQRCCPTKQHSKHLKQEYRTHLFTTRHAHLLETRKLQLTFKNPGSYRC